MGSKVVERLVYVLEYNFGYICGKFIFFFSVSRNFDGKYWKFVVLDVKIY